jgi:hypothetical protein
LDSDEKGNHDPAYFPGYMNQNLIAVRFCPPDRQAVQR